MNIVCIICSELLRHEDIVSTTCGHVFHIKCIEDWLAGSTTCPTCRNQPTTRSSLIKLYFENDDNKGALNLEDILKTNDVLESENKALKEKQCVMEVAMKDAERKMIELKDKERSLERQKHLDDMALAGLRSIKVDSTSQIVKLNESLANLKHDLLAEKQLRRIHQEILHVLDPQNENYDTASITVVDSPRQINGTPDGPKTAAPDVSASPNSPFSSLPFWKLNVEAKQAANDKPKQTVQNYVIPKKIAKGMSPTKLFRAKPRKSDQGGDRPVGFSFTAPSTSRPNGPEPSTSTASSITSQKRTFGEKGFVAPINMATTAATTTSSTFANAFQVGSDHPTFPSVLVASNRPGPSRARMFDLMSNTISPISFSDRRSVPSPFANSPAPEPRSLILEDTFEASPDSSVPPAKTGFRSMLFGPKSSER